MKIRAYLRASTKEQDASRSMNELDEFVKARGRVIHSYYVENKTGTTLDRPELKRLIAEAEDGDALLIEKIDRLSRLDSTQWGELKQIIKSKNLHIVSLELPTSHMIFNNVDDEMRGVVGAVLNGVNNMLLDILAAMARDDYETRRKRQREGIERAKAEGKYKGKQQSPKTIKACEAALKDIELGLSREKAAKANGVGVATLYRYIRENKTETEMAGDSK